MHLDDAFIETFLADVIPMYVFNSWLYSMHKAFCEHKYILDDVFTTHMHDV